MSNLRNAEINKLTKESIAIAVSQLLPHPNFPSFSVTEICMKAGVSRNAYYRNFKDINDILQYYLVMRWEEYEIKEGVAQVPQNDQGNYLIRFFYLERDFVRGLKQHGLLFLIENLFVSIPDSEEIPLGADRYYRYVMAYSIYGFIRAMIDNDFAETPEQICILCKAFEDNMKKQT